MRRHLSVWLLAAVLLIGLWALNRPSHDTVPQGSSAPAITNNAGRSVPTPSPPSRNPASSSEPAARYPAWLPREADAVLDAIAHDGPYAHRQDGNVFQNRERRLPLQARGYYREFTVATPGSPDRGPRRIVTGGDPPEAYWYSDDHYRSFRRFDPGSGVFGPGTSP